jgi:hypothetical protein
MAIPGNPRLYARNIAGGFVPFTQATCRQLTPAELKTVYRNLELVMREYRSLPIPLEEIKALQHRNQVLQRANTALLLIRNHAKRLRVPL